jgi:hypothetical protein
MRKIVLSIFIGYFAFIPFAKAQSIDTLIARFYEKRPNEKIYIQFDNNRYNPGQTIWYKAYLLNGFEPSTLSKNCYIDWYNEEGKIISSSVSPILAGSAWGSFVLPNNYTGNKINVIAYTRWMRNADSAYFFNKQLSVVVKNKNLAISASEFPKTTIQFLPESGNAIIEKNSVVAFKAVNQNGLPANVQGKIKNSKGDLITEFHVVHDGMGKFHYTPQFNEVYTAEWTDEINQTHQTALPAALKTGINLIIDPGKDSRAFHIQRTADVPEAWKRLNLVAQMNGNAVYKATINLSSKESVSSKLPIENFLSGILQVSVFDANQEPVCERLLLINNHDYNLDAELHFDTLNLSKRAKNVFELEVKDSTISNLSISITDGTMNGNADNTIVSQFILQGDLTGHINNPAYYFSSTADSVMEHGDLVMLTNGWRRFKWRELLSGALPPVNFEKDTAYLSLIGKIERISDAKIKKASMMNLMLLSKDSSKAMLFLPLDANGRFSEKNVVFFDTTKVFYSLNGTKIPVTSTVLIENNFFQPDPKKIIRTAQITVDTSGLSRFQFLLSEQERLELLKKQTTLKEVTVYASTKKTKLDQLDQKYTSGMFQGDARAQFDLITSPPMASEPILAYLQGQIAGLNIANPYGEASVSWRGSPTSIYLDEFHIETDQLTNININDVAYIKVFSPPFMGGFGGAGGAIVVYTKKGNDATSTSRGMSFVKVPGYASMREFYSPNYAELQQEYATPDLRSTIYWNPRMITDSKNQKVKINFYNNDFSNSFRVVMEGMDNEGKLVYFSKLLQ